MKLTRCAFVELKTSRANEPKEKETLGSTRCTAYYGMEYDMVIIYMCGNNVCRRKSKVSPGRILLMRRSARALSPIGLVHSCRGNPCQCTSGLLHIHYWKESRTTPISKIPTCLLASCPTSKLAHSPADYRPCSDILELWTLVSLHPRLALAEKHEHIQFSLKVRFRISQCTHVNHKQTTHSHTFGINLI